MTARVSKKSLQVASVIGDLVETKILPGTGIAPETAWSALDALVTEFTPRIKTLLKRRDDFQKAIDAWHQAHPDFDATTYKAFLTEIGYLIPEGPDFQITTRDVCPEIAEIAGPQLV